MNHSILINLKNSVIHPYRPLASTERAKKLTYRRSGMRTGRPVRGEGGAKDPAGGLGDRVGKQNDWPAARNADGPAGSGSGGRGRAVRRAGRLSRQISWPAGGPDGGGSGWTGATNPTHRRTYRPAVTACARATDRPAGAYLRECDHPDPPADGLAGGPADRAGKHTERPAARFADGPAGDGLRACDGRARR